MTLNVNDFKNFSKNPDDYILGVEGNRIVPLEKGIGTWFYKKVHQLDSDKFNRVVASLNNSNGSFPVSQETFKLHAVINDKIDNYNRAHLDRPITKISSEVPLSHSSTLGFVDDYKFSLTEPVRISMGYYELRKGMSASEFNEDPKIREQYEEIQRRLEGLPHVKVEFNADNYSMTFHHEEREVIAIIETYGLSKYMSNLISLSYATAALTGQPFVQIPTPNYKLGPNVNEFLVGAHSYLENQTTQIVKISEKAQMQYGNDGVKLINHLVEEYDGVCIGEGHSDIVPKKFLIENMSTFRNHGVRTLYLEHLFHDTMQVLLDEYHASPTEKMPAYLNYFLSAMNQSHAIYDQNYNFKVLVKTAKAQGIRIVAIDTTISYNCGISTTKLGGISNSRERCLGMNAAATAIIRKYQTNHPGKFIALMGNAHLTTINANVPGVAELLHIPSINIQKHAQRGPTVSYDVTNLIGRIPFVSANIQI